MECANGIGLKFWKRSEKLKSSKSFEQWDSLTAKFSAGSNLPFLLLQLPQIILNARNLLAGNKSALFAVPWLVQHVALQRFSFFVFCFYSFGYSENVGKSREIKILNVSSYERERSIN